MSLRARSGPFTRMALRRAVEGSPRIFRRPLTEYKRPSTAPKPMIDIKHIRENAEMYEENCRRRNYQAQSKYPARIKHLFSQWLELQRSNRKLRERSNLVRAHIANPASTHRDDTASPLKSLTRDQLLSEARLLKAQLADVEESEGRLMEEMQALAFSLPNLTSAETPVGNEPTVLSYINEHHFEKASASDRLWRSHVHIGSELGLLDFAAAGATSGWGWYYLLDEAAQLEQALIQYALAVAARYGWRQVSPPSMVYSHIATACGFQPRDQNDEQQIYTIAQATEDTERGKPELCLAGTSEIPLASMKANTTVDEDSLPMKRVAVSRCYRAEAGGRGANTKGLYRVHEFTKVELFAWTRPDQDDAADVFNEMIDMQTEILESLDLSCRVLEMPGPDLGASATRKCDIEAFFPSRQDQDGGWGEVTSASICTDYQARRLATRLKTKDRLTFPWTINGTALAVPRVLAAILENGWNEDEMTVRIPECLRPWMDGLDQIGPKRRTYTDDDRP